MSPQNTFSSQPSQPQTTEGGIETSTSQREKILYGPDVPLDDAHETDFHRRLLLLSTDLEHTTLLNQERTFDVDGVWRSLTPPTRYGAVRPAWFKYAKHFRFNE